LLDGPNEEAPAEPPLRERLAGRQLVELSLVAGTSSGAPSPDATEFVLETQEVARFTGRFNQLATEIGRWRVEGFRVRLTAADERQAEHLRQILREHGVEALVASLDGPESLAMVVGECSTGFAIPALGIIVLTEAEVFGSRRRSLRRPKYQRGAALTAFSDLAIDDIVVHEDHGLGRYLGLGR
jgi:transcription-repair coupling factor (superfamily II helicase)